MTQATYTSNGNRFWHNTYYGCQAHPFVWSSSTGDYAYITKEQWLQAGNDFDSKLSSFCRPQRSPRRVRSGHRLI